MKKEFKITFSIVLLILSLSAFSQSTDTLKAKRIVISTSVIGYYPNSLNAGNFNLGAEFALKNNNSIYGNVGMIHSYAQQEFGFFNISALSTQGIKIQFEVRHYFNKHKMIEPLILFPLFSPHIFQYQSQTLADTGYYFALYSTFQLTETKREETVLDHISNTPYPNFK